MSHFPGLMCRINDEFSLFIKYESGGFVASVEPEYRTNGTQTWDGVLPRRYKSVKGAKIALGRLLERGLVWVQIEQTI